MKKIIGLVAICLCLALLPLISDAGRSPYGGVDHTKKVKSYTGPETCMACHKTSKMGSNLADDVIKSAHFQLRTMALQIDMPGGGEHGMVDRACGLPGSSMMANNYAGFADLADGSQMPDGCGKCHVGKKMPIQYQDQPIETVLPDVDCLRCHAMCYGDEWETKDICIQNGPNPEPHERKPEQLDGTWTWSQDRTLMSAQSVGNLPLAELCLRCHEHGYTGYKRATPFEPHNDVHAGAGVECYECHVMEKHKIARGNYVSDGVANDMPDVKQSCSIAACHGVVPHTANYAEELNSHVANVSCEACHVSEMTMEGNIARRAWAPYTLDPVTGQWQDTPAQDKGNYWDAYNEYHPVNFWPTLRWFDGTASMLAQPFGGYETRTTVGGCSKIYAFKPFVSGMLFEANFLDPTLSPPIADPVLDSKNYSMKQFYEMVWPLMLAKGLIDAQYPTPDTYFCYGCDGEEMAKVFNSMPIMLYFDRKIYVARAGEVLGTPVTGPQSAATYPGIAAAIDSGLGQFALELGACPPGTDRSECGKGLWSGNFLSMWVPINMDQTSPFAYELGSFISMSHAIKGQAEMGAPCANCHMSEIEYKPACDTSLKRIDFAKMGYPDIDNNGCIDPRFGDIATREVVPGVDRIEMKFVLRKSVEKLVIDVYAIDSGTNAPLADVLVYGTLTGPVADTGLSQDFNGASNNKGVATFEYSRTQLEPGDYTFTVNTLTYSEKTIPKGCSRSITKD